MVKRAFLRAFHGFMCGTVINVILALCIVAIVNKPDFAPLVPDYASHFESKIVALLLQCILIGLTSAIFGAGSVILEFERWSLLKQSVIYFILTAIVWVPVSIFCWRIDKYLPAFISFILSYTLTYIISWSIQLKICKKTVLEINQKLEELKV
ncbi:MAG: hypothetical protein K0R00_3877 [Herbinix sp.]|nr:hypothetical protein [Herbinix sp.]